jgi:hypothetical protein
MSEGYFRPSDYGRQEFYGDESARLAELRALTPADFRAQLIATHDRVMCLRMDESNDFYTGDRSITLGATAIRRFPSATDRARLLTYGLEQAQQCDDIQQAAIVEAATIMATHPFYDRVGGLVRAQYMYRSRGWNIEQQTASGLIKPHSLDELDTAAREYIDFGTACTDETTGLPQLMDAYAYKKTGVIKIADSISCNRSSVLDSDDASSWRVNDFRGLNQADTERLKTLLTIGGRHYKPSGQPARGLLFALSYAATIERFEPYVQDGQKIYLFDALGAMSDYTKHLFITKAWEYYALQAQACIDIAASHELLPASYPYGEMSYADSFTMHTRNFRAPRQALPTEPL